MIVVDTNIWIDHLRSLDIHLVHLIEAEDVLVHPYTVAEVSLGSLRNRAEVVRQLSLFQAPPISSHGEVMTMIELHRLSGTGIGYVDCHLLATALLVSGRLWTRDKRLGMQATKLGVRYDPLDG